MTHPVLKRLSDEQVVAELLLSKDLDEAAKSDFAEKAQRLHKYRVNTPEYDEASAKLAAAFTLKKETSDWRQAVLREALARRDAAKLAEKRV